jgi:hypothetical protein
MDAKVYEGSDALTTEARDQLALSHHLTEGPSAWCVADWLMNLAAEQGASHHMDDVRRDPQHGEIGIIVLSLDGHEYRLEVSREPKDED